MAEIQEFIAPIAIKQVKDLKKDVVELASIYEKLFQASIKADKQLSKMAKSTAYTTEAVKQLEVIRKEEIRINQEFLKTQAKLTQVGTKANKLLIEDQQELRKKNRLQKIDIALQNKNIGTLEKLKLQNQKLRVEKGDLNLTRSKERKRLIEINEQLDKNNRFLTSASDAFEKQKRGIGGYEEAIKNASDGLDLFHGNSIQVLQNLININQQEGGVRAFWGSFVGGLRTATKAALTFIMTPIGAAIGVIVGGIAALSSIIKRNESASDKFNKIWAATTAILDVVIDRVLKLATAYFKLLTFDFAGAAEAASAAFDNLGNSLVNAGKQAVQLKRLTIEIEKMNTALSKTEAELEGQIRLQQIIADDATRSFAEREKAAQKERQLNEQLANERLAVAQKELEAENLRIKQLQENGKIRRSDFQQQAEVYAKLTRAENEFLAVQKENEKTRRELVQDRLERDLDILIDGFDNIKTINERIIADDSRTFEERSKLLNLTSKLGKESFDSQIATIKQFTKVAFDENELLASQDARILNEKIRQLGLSEIIEGRLLEIVRDRRTAIQDLAEAHRDLQKSLKEQLKAEENALRMRQIAQNEARRQEKQELDNWTMAQIEAEWVLNEELEKINKARTDDQKNAWEELQDWLEDKLGKEHPEIVRASVALMAELYQGFTDLRQQQISDELNALQHARDRDLEAVEGDKNKEAQINAKYDKKEAVLKQKQLKAEQQSSLFKIAISTATGIVKALETGFPAAIPLMALAAALGATQAAFVKAQKVPKFSKGSKGLPQDTYGEVGEAGKELLFFPSGQVGLAEKKTRLNMPKGTVIKPNRETEQILAANQMIAQRESDSVLRDYSGFEMLSGAIAKDREAVIKAIDDKSNVMTKTILKNIYLAKETKSGTTTYLDQRLR